MSPAYLGRAVALASAGQFQGAVATAKTAQHIAALNEVHDLAQAIGKRTELYRQHKAYREPPPLPNDNEK